MASAKAGLKMKASVKARRFPVAAACLALLAGGCETMEDYSLTGKVWSTHEFSKWNEPEPSPRLALYEAPDHSQLLVVYDAHSEKHSAVKRRAYYLQPNEARIAERKEPTFVDPAAAEGMVPVPVFEAKTLGTNLPAGFTNYAIVSESGRSFTLYPQATPLGACELPVYRETSNTALRVGLTPFAAAGDVVMVGVVASFMALYVACESGFTYTP